MAWERVLEGGVEKERKQKKKKEYLKSPSVKY
jgi:hypothetical protein